MLFSARELKRSQSGVERAAGFLASAKTTAQLRAVYLCGGGSRTPGLADILADRLRITVEHANPLARLNIRDGALESLIDRRSRAAADASHRPRAPQLTAVTDN